ncbi:hypothetical protein [Leptolyngbya sp. FACHB-16]|uniref:hypothetical protein n=1 Tax=unclassified Leptolyngbya TaxID=2650499 RepID=UPI001685F769|nr:hypothetical protein [Leptolyngbya sp. FACHB-16]MBD2156265.1 hypothetical protein [Leptolyngbya sp. FACHB-16]
MAEELSDQYKDFAALFTSRVLEAVADRNANPIYKVLDEYADPSGKLSSADLALLGIWRTFFKNDAESFLWLGYALSIRAGYENILAYFFITAQQKPLAAVEGDRP